MAVLKSLLRVTVGLGLLSYLFFEHEVKLMDVVGRATSLPLLILVGAVAIDLLGQTFSAYRWSEVAGLGGNPVRFVKTWPVYFSGMFFNMCLPTSVGGDVVRTVGMGRHMKSKTAALASVFMDRNVGLAALLALGLTCAIAWPSTGLEITLFGDRLAVPLWPFFILFGLGYVVGNSIMFSTRVFKLFERTVLKVMPAGLTEKIVKLHDNLQVFRIPLPRYWKVFLLSLGYQLSEVTLVWMLATGLGLTVPFWVYGALVTFQAVAGLLPITINNIGVREGIFCAVLLGQAAFMQIDKQVVKDEALALSLIYFGVIMFSGLVGGVVYLVSGLPSPRANEAQDAAGLPLAPTAVEPAGGGQ